MGPRPPRAREGGAGARATATGVGRTACGARAAGEPRGGPAPARELRRPLARDGRCSRRGGSSGRGRRLVAPGGRVPGRLPGDEGRAVLRDDVLLRPCLLYTSDAADDLLCVDLGGRRIIKKK